MIFQFNNTDKSFSNNIFEALDLLNEASLLEARRADVEQIFDSDEKYVDAYLKYANQLGDDPEGFSKLLNLKDAQNILSFINKYPSKAPMLLDSLKELLDLKIANRDRRKNNTNKSKVTLLHQLELFDTMELTPGIDYMELYRDDNYIAVELLSSNAAKYFGAGSKWCISGTDEYLDGRTSEYFFQRYLDRGVKFIIVFDISDPHFNSNVHLDNFNSNKFALAIQGGFTQIYTSGNTTLGEVNSIMQLPPFRRYQQISGTLVHNLDNSNKWVVEILKVPGQGKFLTAEYQGANYGFMTPLEGYRRGYWQNEEEQADSPFDHPNADLLAQIFIDTDEEFHLASLIPEDFNSEEVEKDRSLDNIRTSQEYSWDNEKEQRLSDLITRLQNKKTIF